MTVFFMPACLRAGKSSVARRGLSRNGVYMRVHAYRKKPQTTTPQAIAIIYRRRIFRSPLRIFMSKMRRENRLWLGGAASRNGVYMRVHEYRKKPLPTTPQAILTSIYLV